MYRTKFRVAALFHLIHFLPLKYTPLIHYFQFYFLGKEEETQSYQGLEIH